MPMRHLLTIMGSISLHRRGASYDPNVGGIKEKILRNREDKISE